MYLLDTNHASAILEGHPAVTSRLAEIGPKFVGIPLVVVGELTYMAEGSSYPSENRERVGALLSSVRIYLPDQRTAETYGTIKAELFRHFGPRERAARRRTTLERLGFGENDLWIAATAL